MKSIDSLQALGIDTLPEIEKLALGKYADRAGKLGHLAQTLATLDMAKAQRGVAAVRKAQDDAAVRVLGGKPSAEDEMQTIVFGDQVTNVPPPVQPSQSGLSKALQLAAALSAGGLLGAAVGGVPWLIDALKKPAAVAPVAPQPGKTTTIERDYEIGPVKVEPPSLFELQEP